jgi:penicillin amidase
MYNGQWTPTELKIDTIKVRGSADVYDTIAFTAFGPVIYDQTFSQELSEDKAIALRWTAHDPSNEGLTFYKLNRAKNYDDYLSAIKTFSCPGQNFVFASKQGDIAIWQQGKFPLRWYGQGMYLMPGTDSSYQWQGFIPQNENPHAHLDSGFLESANQRPVDSAYPYFIPGNYITPRGVSIAKHLNAMEHITVDDMMRLQNDYYSVTAEGVRKILLKYVKESELTDDAKKYLNMVKDWDLYTSANSTGTTVYQTWFDSLKVGIWRDEWQRDSLVIPYPTEETLLEWINKDSAFKYIDNVNTPEKETISDVVTQALQKATPELKEEDVSGTLEWAKHKDPTIYHLLKTAVMPFAKKIHVGGWGNVINAVTETHGPSWRMIVQLSEPTEAYGVYPGGQDGNPGSKYYDNFVDTWANGKYYRLWMMKENEAKDKHIIATLTFTNS